MYFWCKREQMGDCTRLGLNHPLTNSSQADCFQILKTTIILLNGVVSVVFASQNTQTGILIVVIRGDGERIKLALSKLLAKMAKRAYKCLLKT